MVNESKEGDLFNLANYIPGGLCIFNLKDEHPYVKIIAWNNFVQEITGYSFEEVDERVLLKMFSLEEEGLKSVRNLIAYGSEYDDKKENLFRIVTKGGTIKIISIKVSVVSFVEGKYTAIAVINDVTTEKEKELELKEIEERYRRIFESSIDAIIIYDDWEIMYVNKKALEILEFEQIEDIIGENLFNIVHPDYHGVVKVRTKVSKEKQGSVGLIEEKFITNTGKIIDVEIQMTYIPYKGRRCNVAFVRDITKRKEMEERLKKSEKYFRELFNNVNDAIYLNKLEEHELLSGYIEVNNVACRRLGYSREELMRMTVFETNLALNMENVLNLKDKLTKRGNVIYEGLARKKDGKVIPVEINSMSLILNNEKYILSISRDISERKKNEKILKEKEKEYRQLIEALPYAIYILEKDKILFANKIGLDYMGVSNLGEVKNKIYYDLFIPHPSYVQKHKKNLRTVIEKGYLSLMEEKLIRAVDNKILDLETIVTRYIYGETNEVYLVVTRDISDRKKAEALEQDMNEKTKLLEQVSQYEKLRTEFFANISHELRTPVNVIFSTLQLINLNIKDLNGYVNDVDKCKKHVDIMKQNCYRLVRLINNLIDVTKIDSGYFNVNLVNANIISIVEDITQSVAEYVANKGISLIFDTEVEEKIIACDPEKVERIMLNLISNAVKFTEPGGSLFVNIKNNEKSILISVKDTGIGIPKEKQKLIFERFVQVDKSLARRSEGSGIGLSLVKSLVEMHKGTITVESELGKGSEFLVELPVYMIGEEESKISNNDYCIQGDVEKINMEFSDIYF